jgi:5-methylthioribose kinase
MLLLQGGIITERGVMQLDPLTQAFPVAMHVAARAPSVRPMYRLSGGLTPVAFRAVASVSGSFYRLDNGRILDYVASKPQLAERLGGLQARASWTAREVGDGNINFVYCVSGGGTTLVLKQALPYIRMIGESWPLSQDRIKFEAMSLVEERRW